jgi:hypothetical protein
MPDFHHGLRDDLPFLGPSAERREAAVRPEAGRQSRSRNNAFGC